eukprot:tig00020538_g10379.t1
MFGGARGRAAFAAPLPAGIAPLRRCGADVCRAGTSCATSTLNKHRRLALHGTRTRHRLRFPQRDFQAAERGGGAPLMVSELSSNQRLASTVLAAMGLADTAYLTVAAQSVVCPTAGCTLVLTSEYARVFGFPLPVMGLAAYATALALAAGPSLVGQGSEGSEEGAGLARVSALGLQFVSGALAAASVYFVYLMAVVIDEWCIYCLGSVATSLLLFSVSAVGSRAWKLPAAGALSAALFLALAAPPAEDVLPPLSSDTAISSSSSSTPSASQEPSSPAALALASHLQRLGARFYGAFWCTHCAEQKALLGPEAFAMLDYVECDARVQNGVPATCKERGVKGYPTWEINGELYPGIKSLEQLAEISGLDS